MSFLPLRARRCHHWCSGVDWNAKTKFSSVISAGHHWCSGVDWNQSKRYEKRSSWVTTDAVVWIEISGTRIMTRRILVTTDAVVWIEIFWFRRWIARSLVTTDAVVWIEISWAYGNWWAATSPLMQWCGLKFVPPRVWPPLFGHHWCSGVDWNIYEKVIIRFY